MDNSKLSQTETPNRNEDPITHEPGAHPVSTGVGALGGGVTGATIGMAVGGPVGSAVGAVIGAVFGGWGGSAVGEAIDPTVEDEYWRAEHPRQPHATDEYSSFKPAYRVGYEGYEKHRGHERTFEEVEENLRIEYETGGSPLTWAEARNAARAAWTRVHNSRNATANPAAASGLSAAEGTVQPSQEAITNTETTFGLSAAGDKMQPPHEVIAMRAWSYYEADGFQDGHDLDHWFRAEEEEQQRKAQTRTELAED